MLHTFVILSNGDIQNITVPTGEINKCIAEELARGILVEQARAHDNLTRDQVMEIVIGMSNIWAD